MPSSIIQRIDKAKGLRKFALTVAALPQIIGTARDLDSARAHHARGRPEAALAKLRSGARRLGAEVPDRRLPLDWNLEAVRLLTDEGQQQAAEIANEQLDGPIGRRMSIDDAAYLRYYVHWLTSWSRRNTVANTFREDDALQALWNRVEPTRVSQRIKSLYPLFSQKQLAEMYPRR